MTTSAPGTADRERRGLSKRLGKAALRGLRRILPMNLTGDRIFAIAHFLHYQRRLPRRRLLFNDYLLRMKLSGELLSTPRQLISDKELCKLYVDSIIGPGRTVPTLAVLRRKQDVTAEAFPEACVIKSTHGWNQTIIRRDGAPIDIKAIRGFFNRSPYADEREMNYKFLEHKIIVEPIVFDGPMIELKVHCYRGKAKIISVQLPENNALERFDGNWERIPIVQRRRPLPEVPTPRPHCLDEILEAADMLARNFEYIRVDVFVSNEDWLIGELTNCHTNIVSRFADLDQERIFSDILFGDKP